MKRTLRKKWLFIILSLAGYILFARFRYLITFKDTNIVAIWIPAGISLAILLSRGYKYLPLVLIGNYIVAASDTLYEGLSILNTLPQNFITSLTNSAEAALGAYLIYKILKSNLILKNSRNCVSFILITALISLITASLGAFVFCFFKDDWSNYLVLFLSWWINDSLGIFLVTPLIMSFPKKITFPNSSLKILEYVLFIFIIYVFLYIILQTHYPIEFLLVPILLVSLFRFGRFICFIILFIISLYIAIQNSHYEVGSSFYQNENLTIYQLYFSVASILILVFSALIEEQKHTEKELNKGKTQFQSIFNSINEAIIIYDKNYDNVLDVNNHACEWLGYTKEEFKNMSAGDLASNTLNFTKNIAIDYFEKSRKAAQKFKWQIKDKQNNLYYCDIQLNNANIFDSGNIIATIRDESDKYKLEQEITHAYIEAQEEEKQYFGEEIHDNIIQTLSAEQIFISALDKISDKNNDKTSKYIKKLNELNLNAIDAIQKIAYGLMSKQLKEQGLILTLENLCIDMSMKDKIEFNFSHKNIREKDMSEALKTNIFRIAQELTNDSINYSEATIAHLIINKTALNTLEFIFTDNDKGLKLKSLENIDNGRSMKNIDRRLKYLNGHLTVNSKSKTGLEIKITIPLH